MRWSLATLFVLSSGAAFAAGPDPTPTPAPAPVQPVAASVPNPNTIPGTAQRNPFQAELERRQSLRQRKAYQRTAKAYQDRQDLAAQRAYEARMAPIWAAQQAEAARLQIDAVNAAAYQRMATAAQQNAATDAARLRLQQQKAGMPQVYTPNGFMPYPYGVTGPIQP
jgi:hypothetical protein